GRIDIFDDLGTGTFYGSHDYIELEEGRLNLQPVPLNSSAVAAINAALDPLSGQMIALGGSLTSISGTASQDLFNGSGVAGTRLDTKPLALTAKADSDYYSLTLGAGQRATIAMTNLTG